VIQTLLKNIVFLGVAALIFDSCVSQGTLLDRSEILRKPYQEWTVEDCSLIMKDYASTNVLDRSAPASIVVIPCTPNFLLAYNCLKWKKHLCSIDEFYENTDRQARNCFGGSFINQTGQFISGKGAFLRNMSQLDSLLIIIDIENVNDSKRLASWWRESKLRWLIGLSSFFDLFPDIAQMQERISFRAGNVILAKPRYVRYGDATFFEKDKQYAAMFYIDSNLKKHILEYQSVDLYFTIGDHPVVIPVRFSI
jgi:hypothetical protein